MSSPGRCRPAGPVRGLAGAARYVVLGILLALFLSAVGAVAGLLVVHRPLPQTRQAAARR